MHDPRISALLRLKRFEQPPPDYYDRLLRDIHQRQRAELLRRPLWKIAIERLQVFFGEHSMGNLSYAGAMAMLLGIGVAVIGLMTPGDLRHDHAIAETTAVIPTPEPVSANGTNRMLVLGPQSNSHIAPLVSPARDNAAPAISVPRYIIDARPVSYEPVPSFSF